MTLIAKKLRIGTRGSKLALIQANAVCEALRAANPGLEVEIITIKASGDWKPAQGEVRLSEGSGGKGQFVKDIEDAILQGQVDIGVHSLKDVPTFLGDGLALKHFMPREDARDAFISHIAATLTDLPAGAVVGTSSARRAAAILHQRPDLKVTTFRGNVDTRLEKLANGQVDAIILAAAGLKRLGRANVVASYLEPESMLPAVGQGIIAIECRSDDTDTQKLLEPINHAPTRLMALAERALLGVLNGSCGAPIGSYAKFNNEGLMHMRGFLAMPDGCAMYEAQEICSIKSENEAISLGERVGIALKAKTPVHVLLCILA